MRAQNRGKLRELFIKLIDIFGKEHFTAGALADLLQFLIALNFSPEPREFRLSACKPAVWGARRIILSTHLDESPPLRGDVFDLRPDEGVIAGLDER